MTSQLQPLRVPKIPAWNDEQTTAEHSTSHAQVGLAPPCAAARETVNGADRQPSPKRIRAATRSGPRTTRSPRNNIARGGSGTPPTRPGSVPKRTLNPPGVVNEFPTTPLVARIEPMRPGGRGTAGTCRLAQLPAAMASRSRDHLRQNGAGGRARFERYALPATPL